MFLQHEGAGGGFTQAPGGEVWGVEFLVVVDFDSVEQHGRAGFRCFFAAVVETRGAEINVERLPGEGRQSGTYFGFAV